MMHANYPIMGNSFCMNRFWGSLKLSLPRASKVLMLALLVILSMLVLSARSPLPLNKTKTQCQDCKFGISLKILHPDKPIKNKFQLLESATTCCMHSRVMCNLSGNNGSDSQCDITKPPLAFMTAACLSNQGIRYKGHHQLFSLLQSQLKGIQYFCPWALIPEGEPLQLLVVYISRPINSMLTPQNIKLLEHCKVKHATIIDEYPTQVIGELIFFSEIHSGSKLIYLWKIFSKASSCMIDFILSDIHNV